MCVHTHKIGLRSAAASKERSQEQRGGPSIGPLARHIPRLRIEVMAPRRNFSLHSKGGSTWMPARCHTQARCTDVVLGEGDWVWRFWVCHPLSRSCLCVCLAAWLTCGACVGRGDGRLGTRSPGSLHQCMQRCVCSWWLMTKCFDTCGLHGHCGDVVQEHTAKN